MHIYIYVGSTEYACNCFASVVLFILWYFICEPSIVLTILLAAWMGQYLRHSVEMKAFNEIESAIY